MLSIAHQARRSCRRGAAIAAAAAASPTSSPAAVPPWSFSTGTLRQISDRRGAHTSNASCQRILLSATRTPVLSSLRPPPPPPLLLCRSLAAGAPADGAPAVTGWADHSAAGLGNGGETVPLYADGLERLYPHGEQEGDEDEGGGGAEEERGGEDEGERAVVGAWVEGEGEADTAVFGSDSDGVEPEKEGEEGVAAVAGEGGAATEDPSEMRLSRRIARSGIASRREAERLIEEGVVTVNGANVRTPALNVGVGDVVKVNGQSLGRQEEHTAKLWLVHKTRGELVTRQDPQGRRTIFDRLAKLKLSDTLMPVGRLDFNTEGLLLLTNDGDLARRMELPSSNIVRTYSVRVYGNITEEKLRAMRSGCTIDGVRYKGMFVRVEGGGGKGREGRNAWLTIECTEGKNRQIRKICKHLCLKVNRLARTRYGPFSLGKVRAGGVARLDIPQAFLRRLQEGTAGSIPGRGGGAGGSGGDRAGPGPGVAKRRQVGPIHGDAVGGGGISGSSWGRGRGARIRKGVGAPMSRGDNASRGRVQRSR